MALSACRLIFLAGIAAGSLATLVQLFLWWIVSIPLPEVLYRDTRLTAAMVMSRDVINLEQLFQPPDLAIFVVATVIHFGLSLLYAAIFSAVAQRLRIRDFCLLPLGLAFGLALYFINMYGFTFVMTWFALVRDWITIAAHAVFGLCLGVAVWANTRPNAPLLPF